MDNSLDEPQDRQERAQDSLDQKRKNLDSLKSLFDQQKAPETSLGSDIDEDEIFVGMDTGEAQDELNDSTVSPRFSDLRQRMANEQGIAEVTAKETAKLIPETLLTLGEYAGYIGDVQSYDDIARGAQSVVTRMAGADPGEIDVSDIDNEWSKMMRAGKEWVEGLAPIYRQDPNDIMDWDDPAFYIQNIQDLTSSILAFYGVGAGVGAAARAGSGAIARGINAGAKTSRMLQGSSQIGTTAALSMTEGMGEAMQQFEQTRQAALERQLEKGVPRAEAERIAQQAAGEMAATTSALNIGLVSPLNYLSVSPIFRSMGSMKALTNARLAKGADNTVKWKKRIENLGFDQTLLQKYSPVLRESVFESAEEIANVFSGGEGAVRALEVQGEESENTLGERITEAFTSDEGRLSAMLGAIGGSAQHLGIQRIPTRKTEDGFVSPAQAQAEAKVREFEKRKKNIIQRIDDFHQAQKDLAAAAEEGSEAKMQEARDNLINGAMTESVIAGTEHHIEGVIDEMANLSDAEAEKRGFDTDPSSPTYYKKVAQQYKKESEHLKEQWQRHQSDFNWGINEQDAAIPELLFRRYSKIREMDRRQKQMDRQNRETRNSITEFPDALGKEVNVEKEAFKLENARLQALQEMLQNIDEGNFKDGFESGEDLLEAAGFEEVFGKVAEALPQINGLPENADASQYLKGRLKRDLRLYTQSLNGRPLSDVVSDLQSDLDNLTEPEGDTENLVPIFGQKIIESFHGKESAKQAAKMLAREYDFLTSSNGRSEMVQRFQDAAKQEENQRLEEIEESAKEGDAEQIKEDLPDGDTQGKKKAEKVSEEKSTAERKKAMGKDAAEDRTRESVQAKLERRKKEAAGGGQDPSSTDEAPTDETTPTDDAPTDADLGPDPSTAPRPEDRGRPDVEQPPKENFDPEQEAEGADLGAEPAFDPERRARRRSERGIDRLVRGDEDTTSPVEQLQDQIKQAAFNEEPIPGAEDSKEKWDAWERRRVSDLNEVREDWLSDPLKDVPVEQVNQRVDNMIERIDTFRKESLRDAARPERSEGSASPRNPASSPAKMGDVDTGTDPAKPKSPGHTVAYLSREWVEEDGEKQTASNERVSDDVKLAELPDFVRRGTRLTYEVQDEGITGEGDISEDAVNEAHIEVTAHLEDGTKVRIGALPEALFEKMRQRAVGGKDEVNRQLKDLRKIRETVLQAHVSDDIDVIRGRVLGKTGGTISVKYETNEDGEVIPGERDFRSIEEALDGDLKFAVAKDNGFYTHEQSRVNVKNKPDSLPEGTVGLVVPLSNGEQIVAPVWIPTLEESGLADTVASILNLDFESDQRREELSKFVFLRRGDAREIFFDKKASGDNIRLKVTDSGHIFIGRVNSGRIFTSEPNFHTREGAFEGLYNQDGELRDEARELVSEMLMNVDLKRINRDELKGGFDHLHTTPSGETRQESYDTYNQFLREHLSTDLLEETVQGPDGETHNLYSEQPSIYHDVTLDDGKKDLTQTQNPMSDPEHEASETREQEPTSDDPTLEDVQTEDLARVGAQLLNGFDQRPQVAYEQIKDVLEELKRRFDETGDPEIEQVGQNLAQRLRAVLDEMRSTEEGTEAETDEATEVDEEVDVDATQDRISEIDNELSKLEAELDALSGDFDSSADQVREAARILIENNKGSVSLLQRKMQIGFTEAAQVMNYLELVGVVGPFENSTREIHAESAEEAVQMINGHETLSRLEDGNAAPDAGAMQAIEGLMQKIDRLREEKNELESQLEGAEETVSEDRTPINFDEANAETDEAPIASRDIDMNDLDSPVTVQAIKDMKDPVRDLEHMERLLNEGNEDYKKLLDILRESWDLPREGRGAYNSTQVVSFLRKQIPTQESTEDVQEEASDLSGSDLNNGGNRVGGGMEGGAFSFAKETTPAKTMTGRGKNTPVRETNMGESTYESIVEELQSDGVLRITCKL